MHIRLKGEGQRYKTEFFKGWRKEHNGRGPSLGRSFKTKKNEEREPSRLVQKRGKSQGRRKGAHDEMT